MQGIGEGVIIVRTAVATTTLRTTSATAVSVVTASSARAPKVGDPIQVRGATSGTTVTAARIQAGAPPASPPPPVRPIG